jgi:mono/diheme cytochrome c family protein
MHHVRFVRSWGVPVSRLVAVALAAMLGAGSLTSVAGAQTAKQDFDKYCAGCHGLAGKGNGTQPYVMPLTPPPDLTQLAKKNGGVFPFSEVVDIIDGRKNIPSHARLQMPFWGVVLQKEGKEFTPESDADVKRRITALATYIQGMQEK